MDDIQPEPTAPVLVPIGVNNVNDIPAMMRAVIQMIEDGRIAPVAGACVMLNADGDLNVFGWGRTDDIHTIGLLQAGGGWLSMHRVTRG